ncbi:TlpA disulfide reductase family protein [Maricaulis sp.]|jgi:thiol-disulfide isomerase/thioredoxin|uniref:TlpA family protein disulfide reductase n=1 Tax=Maricaulis sp. TaxID=1486257 RepID=UPI0025E2FBD3|nr:TlpA disulfide reductase family protein [Maricaulis sp.]MDF1769500.1 TlpA disulfide reductase family protein [Maricaulis sp.]
MKTPLGIAIFGMAAILVVGFVWVSLVSGTNRGETGPLDSYAHGEMRAFVTLDDAPAQPNLAYIDGDGAEVRLSDYRGQVILVNYWATWCGPCVEEMPALSDLQSELGGDDFQVVTVTLDRSIEDAREFLSRMALDNLPLIHDGTFSSPSQVRAIGLPMSILYDGQGREIGRVPAPAEWNSEDAYALIRAAIRRDV